MFLFLFCFVFFDTPVDQRVYVNVDVVTCIWYCRTICFMITGRPLKLNADDYHHVNYTTNLYYSEWCSLLLHQFKGSSSTYIYLMFWHCFKLEMLFDICSELITCIVVLMTSLLLWEIIIFLLWGIRIPELVHKIKLPSFANSGRFIYGHFRLVSIVAYEIYIQLRGLYVKWNCSFACYGKLAPHLFSWLCG